MSNENVAYDIPIQIQRPVGSTQTMVVGANGTLEVDGILTVATTAPSTATSTGVKGTIAFDTSNIYVCTATNTWKRVAIATF